MADDGCVSHGNVYDHFEEYNEVFSLIDSLPAIVKDFRALEAAQERLTCKDGFLKTKLKAFFIAIVDKYQEQPHLLDPHLGKGISHVIYFL